MIEKNFKMEKNQNLKEVVLETRRTVVRMVMVVFLTLGKHVKGQIPQSNGKLFDGSTYKKIEHYSTNFMENLPTSFSKNCKGVLERSLQDLGVSGEMEPSVGHHLYKVKGNSSPLTTRLDLFTHKKSPFYRFIGFWIKVDQTFILNKRDENFFGQDWLRISGQHVDEICKTENSQYEGFKKLSINPNKFHQVTNQGWVFTLITSESVIRDDILRKEVRYVSADLGNRNIPTASSEEDKASFEQNKWKSLFTKCFGWEPGSIFARRGEINFKHSMCEYSDIMIYVQGINAEDSIEKTLLTNKLIYEMMGVSSLKLNGVSNLLAPSESEMFLLFQKGQFTDGKWRNYTKQMTKFGRRLYNDDYLEQINNNYHSLPFRTFVEHGRMNFGFTYIYEMVFVPPENDDKNPVEYEFVMNLSGLKLTKCRIRFEGCSKGGGTCSVKVKAFGILFTGEEIEFENDLGSSFDYRYEEYQRDKKNQFVLVFSMIPSGFHEGVNVLGWKKPLTRIPIVWSIHSPSFQSGNIDNFLKDPLFIYGQSYFGEHLIELTTLELKINKITDHGSGDADLKIKAMYNYRAFVGKYSNIMKNNLDVTSFETNSDPGYADYNYCLVQNLEEKRCLICPGKPSFYLNRNTMKCETGNLGCVATRDEQTCYACDEGFYVDPFSRDWKCHKLEEGCPHNSGMYKPDLFIKKNTQNRCFTCPLNCYKCYQRNEWCDQCSPHSSLKNDKENNFPYCGCQINSCEICFQYGCEKCFKDFTLLIDYDTNGDITYFCKENSQIQVDKNCPDDYTFGEFKGSFEVGTLEFCYKNGKIPIGFKKNSEKISNIFGDQWETNCPGFGIENTHPCEKLGFKNLFTPAEIQGTISHSDYGQIENMKYCEKFTIGNSCAVCKPRFKKKRVGLKIWGCGLIDHYYRGSFDPHIPLEKINFGRSFCSSDCKYFF